MHKGKFLADVSSGICVLFVACAQENLGPDQLNVNDVIWTKVDAVPFNIEGDVHVQSNVQASFVLPPGRKEVDNLDALSELDFFNILFPPAIVAAAIKYTNINIAAV